MTNKKELMVTDKNWTPDQVNLIKRTVANGTTDDELTLFLYTCKHTGLDPLLRQIYCVKRNDSEAGNKKMTIQTGIDGYRLIADRTKRYAGNEDATFETDNNGKPIKATVTVYKLVGGQKMGFTASARWSEYFPGEKGGFMWKKMPFGQLAKCAESLALRKAFPAELGAVYTTEEMEQAESTPKEAPEMPKRLSDTPKPASEAPAAQELKSQAPAHVPETEEKPTPAGFAIMKAVGHRRCNGCGQEFAQGSDFLFSGKKGSFHYDCIPV